MELTISEGDNRILEYSSREGEIARNDINDFVPASYTRHPLPLQEIRGHYMVYDNVKTETVTVPPSDPLVDFTNENGTFDTKQDLFRSLLGQSENINILRTTGPQTRDGVTSRLSAYHCNASFIDESQLLVQLVSCILSGQGIPEGEGFECITSIDLSHTVLGVVGSQRSPYYMDEGGNPSPGGTSSSSRVLAFFPNETHIRDKREDARKVEHAHCSLAFAYIAPLLWFPGRIRFSVTELTCQHCLLGDDDAIALALILRSCSSQNTLCVLERIDLSFNKITNVGAETLKKAVKYNQHVKALNLVGNEGIMDIRILDLIQKRLKRNKKGRSNLSSLQRLKRWLRE